MSSMSRTTITFSLARLLALAAGLTFVQGCSRGNSRQGYLESGNRYLTAGQFAEAVIQYRNAVQKDPRAGDAHAKLAEALLGTGDLANGLREYVRAADLLPDDLALQVKSGNLLLLAG